VSDTDTRESEAGLPRSGNVFHAPLTTSDGGTLNAFAGDQYNYGDQYHLSFSALRRRIRYAADTARLDREMRLVVPPPHLERDLDAMREHQLLVLTGGPHTGLSTAARQRRRAFAAEVKGAVQEELFASERDELLDELGHLKRPGVLLLDLSHDTVLGAQLTERFEQLQTVLREQRSWLVIAMGDDCHQAAARALPGAVHRVGRPDPFAVMGKRMRHGDRLERLRADPQARSLLAEAWPPQAVSIAEALDNAAPDAGIAQFIEQVKQRVDDRNELLRQLFEDKCTSGSPRALLLATSALEGSGRDTIAFAARDLSEASGEAHPYLSVLEDRSLNEQFGELESVLQAGSDRFRDSGYGDAILPFAWNEFPSWRAPIQAWLDVLLKPQRLQDDTLAVLLPRLLSLASATGAADLVTVRAARIAAESGGGSRSRRDLAAELLLAGAIDTVIGPQVRRQLWRWSFYRGNAPLQRAVASVCSDPDYALRFPRNALTRLKHLMKSETEAVRLDAVAAITAVARSLPAQVMVEQLVEWISQGADPQLRDSVPELLAVLLNDERVRERWSNDWLARDPAGMVESLWRSVLVYAHPGAVRDAMAGWLTLAAASPPERRFPLTDLPAAAAANHFWTLGQLSQAVTERAWAERDADADVLTLRDRISRHLSQAKVSF
jgi:hypothetical protein